MSAADTAAVKAIVESAGALATHVFVTNVASSPVQALPYVLIHPSEGNDESTRLTGPPITEHPEFTFHIVGASAASVQVVTGLIKAKFKATSGFIVPPTVAGRRNDAGYWRSPLPIQTDKAVTPWLIYGVVELGWTSNPA